MHSQIDVHAVYGGVVPELASRDHVRYLRPLVDETIEASGMSLADLDAVAYTTGPGLLGALLVGSTFAKTLAFSINCPALGVHHMEGHLLAPLMDTRFTAAICCAIGQRWALPTGFSSCNWRLCFVRHHAG